MVRNTHGGNKSKGMARKDFNSSSAGGAHAPLRIPNGQFEQISIVSKMLGNGMFYATTTDGIQLLAHIRNKFKGRSRRNNDVSVGKLVLLGLRDWEAPHFKQADLLLVYDDYDISTLYNSHDLSAFHNSNFNNTSHDFSFANIDDSNYNNINFINHTTIDDI